MKALLLVILNFVLWVFVILCVLVGLIGGGLIQIKSCSEEGLSIGECFGVSGFIDETVDDILKWGLASLKRQNIDVWKVQEDLAIASDALRELPKIESELEIIRSNLESYYPYFESILMELTSINDELITINKNLDSLKNDVNELRTSRPFG